MRRYFLMIADKWSGLKMTTTKEPDCGVLLALQDTMQRGFVGTGFIMVPGGPGLGMTLNKVPFFNWFQVRCHKNLWTKFPSLFCIRFPELFVGISFFNQKCQQNWNCKKKQNKNKDKESEKNIMDFLDTGSSPFSLTVQYCVFKRVLSRILTDFWTAKIYICVKGKQKIIVHFY